MRTNSKELVDTQFNEKHSSPYELASKPFGRGEDPVQTQNTIPNLLVVDGIQIVNHLLPFSIEIHTIRGRIPHQIEKGLLALPGLTPVGLPLLSTRFIWIRKINFKDIPSLGSSEWITLLQAIDIGLLEVRVSRETAVGCWHFITAYNQSLNPFRSNEIPQCLEGFLRMFCAFPNPHRIRIYATMRLSISTDGYDSRLELVSGIFKVIQATGVPKGC